MLATSKQKTSKGHVQRLKHRAEMRHQQDMKGIPPPSGGAGAGAGEGSESVKGRDEKGAQPGPVCFHECELCRSS